MKNEIGEGGSDPIVQAECGLCADLFLEQGDLLLHCPHSRSTLLPAVQIVQGRLLLSDVLVGVAGPHLTFPVPSLQRNLSHNG